MDKHPRIPKGEIPALDEMRWRAGAYPDVGIHTVMDWVRSDDDAIKAARHLMTYDTTAHYPEDYGPEAYRLVEMLLGIVDGGVEVISRGTA